VPARRVRKGVPERRVTLAATDPPAAGLDRSQLLDLYRWMYLARVAEERLEILQRQGHITGSIYRGLGQEAGAVGAAYALHRRDDGSGDVLAHTVRATGALFLFGGRPIDLFRQYLARSTSPTGGRETNVHWVDDARGIIGPVSPLGTMLEVMAGVALSFRMREEKRVGVAFCGDGASSTGAWHEGLGFAAAQRVPLVLMVEANQWAFSTPTSRNTRVVSFADKAPAYGIEAQSVDGTDVVAVWEATRRAADRARGGGGVQMVEMRYFRRLGHAQHDPQDYVDPEVLAAWKERDPLDRHGARLLDSGSASEEELERLRNEIDVEIREAAERAVAEPTPSGEDALGRVYTDVSTPVPWTRREGVDRGVG